MEFKTKNGANVKMAIADFESVMNLQDALISEIASSGIKIDASDFSSLKEMDLDIGQILTSAMRVAGSKPVRAAIFDCLKKCSYNQEKITLNFFDDCPDARDDYYELVFACLKENLSPFFKGLVSGLSVMGFNPKSDQSPIL